jgi:hypothetical protein
MIYILLASRPRALVNQFDQGTLPEIDAAIKDVCAGNAEREYSSSAWILNNITRMHTIFPGIYQGFRTIGKRATTTPDSRRLKWSSYGDFKKEFFDILILYVDRNSLSLLEESVSSVVESVIGESVLTVNNYIMYMTSTRYIIPRIPWRIANR